MLWVLRLGFRFVLPDYFRLVLPHWLLPVLFRYFLRWAGPLQVTVRSTYRSTPALDQMKISSAVDLDLSRRLLGRHYTSPHRHPK